MKVSRFISIVAALALFASTPVWADASNPPKATSDAEKAVKKAATQAARIGIGAAVGGKVGKIITGSPAGAGVGVILTPTEIGCGQGEYCPRK